MRDARGRELSTAFRGKGKKKREREMKVRRERRRHCLHTWALGSELQEGEARFLVSKGGGILEFLFYLRRCFQGGRE